ncbi:MAG: lycopene beta-cyclase CrtY [Pseudomonadota bacterium]
MDFDLIFVGGGLSSSLAAYRLRQTRPELRIAIVEKDERLGGNHTWCFHATDVTRAQLAWLTPFITTRWEGQSVRFPARERHLTTPYLSSTSDRLDEVMDGIGITRISGQPAAHVEVSSVTLADQTVLNGTVIDGRGPNAADELTIGFQKFLGLELKFSKPHGLQHPIIMDATVPQTDGYRFVYVLPFTENTALIEDTYYADGHQFERQELRDEIHAYAARQGWDIAEVIREEEGVLPIVLEGDLEAYFDHFTDQPAPIGLRAALFHPITGYSLPEAAALADVIAVLPQLTPNTVAKAVREQSLRRWRAHRFSRLLNRMLFRAAEPELRYVVLQRFYGLPQALIERFYAGRSTLGDRARILAGKPPVPIIRAIKALAPRGVGTGTEA